MPRFDTNTIVIATNNPHKSQEFKQILGPKWSVLTASDIGDIIWDETGTTFEQNSLIKAEAVSSKLPADLSNALILADDSGLCVDALGGEPGVYSSRYSGTEGDHQKNNEALLENMTDISEGKRTAHFVCVLTVMQNGKVLEVLKGVMPGKIATQPWGNGGFGYDPLFIADGYSDAVATLSDEEKNAISHRGKALQAFEQWITTD